MTGKAMRVLRQRWQQLSNVEEMDQFGFRIVRQTTVTTPGQPSCAVAIGSANFNEGAAYTITYRIRSTHNYDYEPYIQ